MVKWLGRLVILPVVALAAYGAFQLSGSSGGPAPGERERIESYLKNCVTDSIVEDIHFDEKLASLYVLPVRNDFKGDIRRLIQRKVEELGFVRLEEDASKVARRIRELGGGEEGEPAILERFRAFLQPDEKAAYTEAEALEFGRRYGMDALLLASVVEVGSWDESPSLAIESKVIHAGTGETVIPRQEHRAALSRSLLSLPYVGLRIRGISPWLRVLCWLGVTLSLPLALAPLVRSLLARESNRVNGLLLGCLTGVDIFAIWVLLGFRGSGFLPFVAIILGACAALAYNFVLLTKLDALRR